MKNSSAPLSDVFSSHPLLNIAFMAIDPIIEDLNLYRQNPALVAETCTRALVERLKKEGWKEIPEEGFHNGITKMLKYVGRLPLVENVIENIVAMQAPPEEILERMQRMTRMQAAALNEDLGQAI